MLETAHSLFEEFSNKETIISAIKKLQLLARNITRSTEMIAEQLKPN